MLIFQEDRNCIFLFLTESSVKGALSGHLSAKAQALDGFNLPVILFARLCLYCSLYLKIAISPLVIQTISLEYRMSFCSCPIRMLNKILLIEKKSKQTKGCISHLSLGKLHCLFHTNSGLESEKFFFHLMSLNVILPSDYTATGSPTGKTYNSILAIYSTCWI